MKPDLYEEALIILGSQGYCAPQHYPWDYWEKKALAAGVPEELASLGRSVMREAHQHAWGERLQCLCGWADKGRRMIRLALKSPKTADKRWRDLLNTDGNRGRWDEKTGRWISWI
jgi:hypothetical protein